MPLDNPFQDPLRFERKLPECAVVIFGANGDLTKRKLLPGPLPPGTRTPPAARHRDPGDFADPDDR